MSWKEAHKRCPAGVYPVCHNSLNSVTISGDAKSVDDFLVELHAEGIFAKLVNSSNIAFHSKYSEIVGDKLRPKFEEIIPIPKQRSSHWISTSIPENQWQDQLAQTSSAAYFINNLLSPVLFQEAVQHIPNNAIVIEIAPNCLFQAILRRSLPSTVINIGLQKANHINNTSFFMENLGKLYIAGAQPNLSIFYPIINYPVGRGTPMLSTFIEWDHSEEWMVANFMDQSQYTGECVVNVDISTKKDEYITGHKIST